MRVVRNSVYFFIFVISVLRVGYCYTMELLDHKLAKQQTTSMKLSKQSVMSLEHRVETVEGKLQLHQSDVCEINGKIQTLTDKIDQLECEINGKIQTLTDKSDQLEKVKSNNESQWLKLLHYEKAQSLKFLWHKSTALRVLATWACYSKLGTDKAVCYAATDIGCSLFKDQFEKDEGPF